jgi:hypothetical protein
MKKIFAICCILGFPLMLQAQVPESKPELPPGPLIEKRASDFAEWVVTKKMGSLDDTASGPNTPPAGQGATAPESTEDTITKTHDVIRVVRLDTAKRPWTIWCHGAQEYMIWPDGKSCAGINPSFGIDYPNPFYINLSASDFPGFEWVSRQNYAGIKSYQGIKCIVFQIAQSTPLEQVAYIDFKSRFPVALQSGGEVYLYTWNAPPQAMLSFPSMVQALIDAGVKDQRQMAQKAVRPW